MPSPMAQNLSMNFKARARRHTGQGAFNFEVLAWPGFDEGSAELVGPNWIRHDLVESLDPYEQTQPLLQEHDHSQQTSRLS